MRILCSCSAVGHSSPQTDDTAEVKDGDLLKMYASLLNYSDRLCTDLCLGSIPKADNVPKLYYRMI